MWKDYLSSYIKNNHSSRFAIQVSAFISALLLSLLCGLFYNIWKYEVERIEQKEGSWQSRIIGEFDKEEITFIKNFASIKDAVINEKEGKGTAVDLYFNNKKNVFSDTSNIAKLIGISSEKTVYHYSLLAMYGIRDAKDTAPRLLFPMFFMITGMASVSLIVIIHNAFAVSMNSRIHQFGIFSSIGATPKQIRSCLLQEAAFFCAIPVIAGNLLGIIGSIGILNMTNILLGSSIEGRHKAVFGYHPLVFFMTLFLTAATVWISAWLPARKLSRLTPLEAIKSTEELHLKYRRKFYFLTFLFGIEGELAGNALTVQRKALRTATISFLFSFLAFAVMQCFFVLSEISTRETYFERYQDVWDIMITIKDTPIDEFKEIKAVQELVGVKSAVVYQKAAAKRMITEEEISEEMASFGGFSYASENYVTKFDKGWLVNAPILILDDNSFLTYCKQIGILPQLNGAVIRNLIRDVTNLDFRHPEFMPYIKEDAISILRHSEKEKTAKVSVLSYTKEVPVLRENYATLDYYELVHFIPVSLWREIKEQIGGSEDDIYICVRGREEITLEELNILQDKIVSLIGQNYTLEYENRIQEYRSNSSQIKGIKVIFGGFCILLAIIGIGSVFSNTLGFVHQRKRELARYMSIGLTPKEIRKIFCIEALMIAGRPILITLPLAAALVWYMLKISYVEIKEFLAEAPLISIAVFMLAVLGTVASAYYFAWRKMRNINLTEILRDDTMM